LGIISLSVNRPAIVRIPLKDISGLAILTLHVIQLSATMRSDNHPYLNHQRYPIPSGGPSNPPTYQNASMTPQVSRKPRGWTVRPTPSLNTTTAFQPQPPTTMIPSSNEDGQGTQGRSYDSPGLPGQNGDSANAHRVGARMELASSITMNGYDHAQSIASNPHPEYSRDRISGIPYSMSNNVVQAPGSVRSGQGYHHPSNQAHPGTNHLYTIPAGANVSTGSYHPL
jgi:hypothetical protein